MPAMVLAQKPGRIMLERLQARPSPFRFEDRA